MPIMNIVPALWEEIDVHNNRTSGIYESLEHDGEIILVEISKKQWET